MVDKKFKDWYLLFQSFLCFVKSTLTYQRFCNCKLCRITGFQRDSESATLRVTVRVRRKFVKIVQFSLCDIHEMSFYITWQRPSLTYSNTHKVG